MDQKLGSGLTGWTWLDPYLSLEQEILPIQRLSEGVLRAARLPGRLVLVDQDASVLGDLSPEMPEFPHMVVTFSRSE